MKLRDVPNGVKFIFVPKPNELNVEHPVFMRAEGDAGKENGSVMHVRDGYNVVVRSKKNEEVYSWEDCIIKLII